MKTYYHETQYPNYLMHYGVKGMKWGVRHDTYKSASSRRNKWRSTLRNYTGSRKSTALNEYRHKNVDEMTNAELQEAVNRMNLERNYRSLTKMDIGKGKRFIDTLLNYENTYRRVKSSELVKAGAKILR